MATILKMDDLEVGQLITVHSYIKKKIEISNDVNPDIAAAIKMQEQAEPVQRELLGVPIQIVSMNLPFLVIKVFSPQIQGGITVGVLDTRKTNLMKVSLDYCENICGKLFFDSFLKWDARGPLVQVKQSEQFSDATLLNLLNKITGQTIIPPVEEPKQEQIKPEIEQLRPNQKAKKRPNNDIDNKDAGEAG